MDLNAVFPHRSFISLQSPQEKRSAHRPRQSSSSAILEGLGALGSTLGQTVTTAIFEPVLTGFVTADTSSMRRGAAAEARQTALGDLYAWLLKARTVLAGRLGLRWSEAWVAAGFTNAMTAISPKPEDRLALTASLVNYFTTFASYQVASMEVTAAKETRATKQTALLGLMRRVIRELTSALGPLDPRWTNFGLNMPGAETTPGQPQELLVYEDATGGIFAQCAETPLATRYRWRIKVQGVDESYRLAVGTAGPMATIKDVQPGNVVDVIVQAVNGRNKGRRARRCG